MRPAGLCFALTSLPTHNQSRARAAQIRHGPDTYRASLAWETPAQVAAAAAAAALTLDELYGRVTPARYDPPPKVNPPPVEGGSAPRLAVAATEPAAAGLTARVVLDGSDQGLAAGQYAVLYDTQGTCFGCAVILGAIQEDCPWTDAAEEGGALSSEQAVRDAAALCT